VGGVVPARGQPAGRLGPMAELDALDRTLTAGSAADPGPGLSGHRETPNRDVGSAPDIALPKLFQLE